MKMDVGEILRGLENLGKARESIARRMLVAGGQVIRDEVRSRAPEGDEITGGYARDGKTGSHQPGTLKRSVYLAYSDKRSDGTVFTYSVSWNSKPGSASNAFWGVMQEFGHRRPYAIAKVEGGFATMKPSQYRGPNPRFAGASFLGAGFDASLQTATAAIMAEGKRAFIDTLGNIT